MTQPSLANKANFNADVEPGPAPVGGHGGQSEPLSRGKAGPVAKRKAYAPRRDTQHRSRPRGFTIEWNNLKM